MTDAQSRTLIPLQPVTTPDGRVVFFGGSLTNECQRCGAYGTTGAGHKFCAEVACPIAIREFRRRQRKRTSSLEKVYLPAIEARKAAPPAEISTSSPATS